MTATTSRFDSGRVAVIAGSGSLPVAVADSLARGGEPPLILIIEGEADHLDELQRHEHFSAPVEHAAPAFERLRRSGVSRAVLAGGVQRRPRLSRLRLTPRTILSLPALALNLARGDDSLLRGVIRHLEQQGIRIVGAHEVVPDLLARPGTMTATKPDRQAERDMAASVEAALAIGRLDIGQAAVAVGGRVIALEGIEGTQGLLERTITLRSHGRLAGRPGGVLVKCAKPGQELRADMPGIGPDTIDQVHRAGLTGIGLQAGRSLILDFEATIDRANELGLFVHGLEMAHD